TGTICRENYRQGCSIVDLAHGRFADCTFSDSDGTAPESGVDIEPFRPDHVVDDIEFRNCTFRDNREHGLVISLDPAPTAVQANIRVIDSAVFANNDGVLLFRHARDIAFAGCDIRDNRGRGVIIFSGGRDVQFAGGAISDNGAHGLEAVTTPNERFSGLEIRNVEMLDNSRGRPGRWDGIHLRNALTDVVIDHCTITGSHRYGISATDQVRRLHLGDNAMDGNVEGPTNLPATVIW
ncbi:MAG: right-handed parallel beta-helix repeat-containing protein, partial [Haloechinothrix sp.]